MNRREKTPLVARVSPYFQSIVETKSKIGRKLDAMDQTMEKERRKNKRKEGRKEGVHPLTREGNEFTAGDNSLVPN